MKSEHQRTWHKLRAIAWILLTATLGFLLFREFRPAAVAPSDEGSVSLALLMVLATLGGAMLVGAKLATAPSGGRPSFREMLLYILSPPVLTALAFGGINRLGGGPVQTYVAPVLATVEKGEREKDYVIHTLDHEGQREAYEIASGVPPSGQKKWQDFGGLKVGTCMAREWRNGLLDLPVDVGWKPVPCPPRHGEAPPEGPAKIHVGSESPNDWQWVWYPAAEGPSFPLWKRRLHRIVSEESHRLIGLEIRMIARLELDGRVSQAQAVGDSVPTDVAERLTESLVGSTDVLRWPAIELPYTGPIWVQVPVNVQVVEPLDDEAA